MLQGRYKVDADMRAGVAVLVLELEGRDRVEAAVLVLELEGRCWNCSIGAGAGR